MNIRRKRKIYFICVVSICISCIIILINLNQLTCHTIQTSLLLVFQSVSILPLSCRPVKIINNSHELLRNLLRQVYYQLRFFWSQLDFEVTSHPPLLHFCFQFHLSLLVIVFAQAFTLFSFSSSLFV